MAQFRIEMTVLKDKEFGTFGSSTNDVTGFWEKGEGFMDHSSS